MSLLRRSFVWRPLLVLTITFAIMGSLAIGLIGSRPASAGQEWFIGYAGLILIQTADSGSPCTQCSQIPSGYNYSSPIP